MAAKRRTNDPNFDRAWELYPKRPDNSKQAARKAWNARLKEGILPEEMIRGVEAYARWCDSTNRQPEYIKLAATFFGPSHHFRNSFDGGPTGARTEEESGLLRFYEQEPLV